MNISNAESGQLTARDGKSGDFNSTSGTVKGTYSGSSDGTYNATLMDANDSAGNNGSTGQSDTVDVSTGGGADTNAPNITGFTVSNPSGQDVQVKFTTNESLDEITVDITGAESGQLTASGGSSGDFNSTSGTIEATYTGSTDGTYTAKLIDANDSSGNNGSTGQSESVSITSKPSVKIDIKTNEPETGSKVTFNGSNSTDPDGTITSYEWTINGTTKTGKEVNETFDSPGIYEVELNITDDNSNTASETTKFLVTNSSGSKVSGTENNSGYRHGVQSVVDAVSLNWSYDTGASVNSSPAVMGDNVYVGSSTGKLYKLDSDNGTEIWNFSTGDDVNSSPVVKDGTVYFGSNDDKLYAVDAETGKEQWNYSTGGDVESSPKIVDRTVYFGSSDRNVYAVDAATGTKQWNYSTEGQVDASPAVNDSTVYVASKGHKLYALDAGDGTLDWNFGGSQNFEPLLSAPAVVEGQVYVGGKDDHLYAVNEDNGNEVWSYQSSDDIDTSPAVHNGTVYIGLTEGSLTALDTGDGEEIWDSSMGEVHSSSRLASGTVYLGSDDHRVYAVNSDTGSKLWNYTTNGDISSAPAVNNGSVYVASGDGKVYSLNGSTTDVTSPTANTGTSFYVVNNDTSVEFDGSPSSDAGGVKNYSWDFNNDSTEDATGVKPSYTFSSPGTHQVTLTVTDEAGNKDTVNITIDVQSVDDGGSSGDGGSGNGSGDSGDSGVGVSPKNLNYGTVEVGEVKTLNVTIKNPSSTAGIRMSDSRLVGPNKSAFSVTDGTDAPFTLGPDESHQVTVELAPVTKGVKNGQLQLFSNSSIDSQVDVWLTNEKTVLIVQQVETESVKVTGKNLKNDSSISLNVSQPTTRKAEAGLDELNMTVENQSDFDMYVNNSESSGGVPDANIEGKDEAMYVEINHENLPSSEIDNTSFTIRVKKQFDDVGVYRYNTTMGEWRTLSVTKGKTLKNYVKYHVDTPDFSTFSVQADPTSTGSGDGGGDDTVGGGVGGGGTVGGAVGPIGSLAGGSAETSVKYSSSGNNVTKAIIEDLQGAGDKVRIEPGLTDAAKLTGVYVSNVRLALGNGDGSGEVSVQEYVDAPSAVKPLTEVEEVLGYSQVSSGFSSDRIQNADVEFNVSKDILRRKGLSLDNLSVYRYNGSADSWNRMNTNRDERPSVGNATLTVYTGEPGKYYAVGVRPSGNRFEIIDTSLDKSEATEGESVSVDVSIKNTGDRSGEYTVKLRADNQTVSSERFFVLAGQSGNETVSHAFSEEGVYDLSVNGKTVGELSVKNGNNTEVSSVIDKEPSDSKQQDDGGSNVTLIIGVVMLIVVLSVLLIIFAGLRKRQ
ncbi:MAG: PQQ-binding-like beta-propeller repeat protein [Halobacteria archaeon]